MSQVTAENEGQVTVEPRHTAGMRPMIFYHGRQLSTKDADKLVTQKAQSSQGKK